MKNTSSPKSSGAHKHCPVFKLSEGRGNKVPRWPPPDAPHSLGILAIGSKLSSCSFWLPPAFYPPGETKQPLLLRVTFAGAVTSLQPCSVPGSHIAGFVPLGRSTETHRGLLPAAATPDASMEVPDMHDALAGTRCPLQPSHRSRNVTHFSRQRSSGEQSSRHT